MVGVHYGVLETKWSKYIEDLVINFVKWHKVLELIIGFSNIEDIQFSSVTQSCLTLCNPMDCLMPGFPVYHQLPELTQTYAHWVGDAIQPCHSLLFPSPAFNLSQHQGLFKWISSRIKWPKDWSFSFSISPSNEYSGLISFRIDWLDLLAVQEDIDDLERTV